MKFKHETGGESVAGGPTETKRVEQQAEVVIAAHGLC